MSEIDDLNKVFGEVEVTSDINVPIKFIDETEHYFKVRAKAKYYTSFFKVFLPDEPYWKLKPGVVIEKIERPKSINPYKETNAERSIRRTKQKIFDYVQSNKFDLFCTFTFREERGDVYRCKSRMQNWIKRMQKKDFFSYLIIPEFHVLCDSCAQLKKKTCDHPHDSLHFHALFKDYPGEVARAREPITFHPLTKKGRDVYSIISYLFGYEEAYYIDTNDPKDQAFVGRYISKYITKDMPKLFGKNRYWHSNDLVLPEEEDNPPEKLYTDNEPMSAIVVDNGMILYFSNDILEKKDK